MKDRLVLFNVHSISDFLLIGLYQGLELQKCFRLPPPPFFPPHCKVICDQDICFNESHIWSCKSTFPPNKVAIKQNWRGPYLQAAHCGQILPTRLSCPLKSSVAIQMTFTQTVTPCIPMKPRPGRLTQSVYRGVLQQAPLPKYPPPLFKSPLLLH